MNILFVADPLEVFKTYKDTTFSMMREAQRRGHRLFACEPRHLTWRSGDLVHAELREITLTASEDEWFQVQRTEAGGHGHIGLRFGFRGVHHQAIIPP